MKALLIYLPFLHCASALSTLAGGLNIVNLAHGGDLVVKVEFDKTSQNLIVKAKDFSGAFGLPETKVKLTALMDKAEQIEIPATADSHLAILAKTADGYAWRLIPSKPTEGKWSLRIVNLSEMPLPVVLGNNETKELEPASDTSIPAEHKGQIRVKIPDSKSYTYKGDEPCAVVALVYRELEEWEVVFVSEF